MRILTLTAVLSLALGASSTALAQPATVAPGAPASPVAPAPAPGGAVVAPTPGTTGNDPNVNISRDGTGAGSIQTDSSAGGNAAQPSRAVPQGGSGK